ncbi:MAG: hypothetical protein JXJ04_06535 [Spirochaetales bacterium]|nr:hypothetical protein [Spirochaetales bacterium]
MKKKIKMLYVIIPFIYVLVIIVFFLFHFMGKDPFKSESLGYLTISGARSRIGLFSKQEISDLKAHFGGFQLIFSGGTPLVFESEDGKREICKVDTYSIFETAVEIKYTNGLALRIRVTGDSGDRADIMINKLPLHLQSGNILIHFLIGGTDIERPGGIPVLSCINSFEQFFLSLSDNSQIDYDNKILVLKNFNNSTSVISIEKGKKEYQNPYLYWLLTKTDSSLPPEYEETVNDYISLSYNNWISGRYRRDESKWVNKDGNAFFSEHIINAMLSESLRRSPGNNEFRRALSIAGSAIEQRKSEERKVILPFLSSPFLGNLEMAVKKFQEEDSIVLKEVEGLILKENPGVFLIPHVLLLLLDRGNISQIDELVSRVINNADPDKVDTATRLGMIDVYYDVVLWFKTKEPYFAKYKNLLLTHIVPNIIRTRRGLFLMNKETETASILHTLHAGSILQKAAIVTGNTDFGELGKKCILSALSLADEEGYLPGEMVIRGYDNLITLGTIAPEDIYGYIVFGGYLPREIPLYPEIRPGVWIWTAAKDIQVKKSERELTLTLSFPKGFTHYFFIQGIQPFTELYLHDKKIDENEEYMQNSYGWYYSEVNRTLYVKCDHRNEEETLVILY